jgi:hypothetical protein
MKQERIGVGIRQCSGEAFRRGVAPVELALKAPDRLLLLG